MEREELVRLYEEKSEEELLRLQLYVENLTPEATAVLTDELTKRRIHSPDRLEAFRDDERNRKEEESRNPGKLFLYFRFGIGRWHLGKADRTYDQIIGSERFRTTIFSFVSMVPINSDRDLSRRKKARCYQQKENNDPEKTPSGLVAGDESLGDGSGVSARADLGLEAVVRLDLFLVSFTPLLESEKLIRADQVSAKIIA